MYASDLYQDVQNSITIIAFNKVQSNKIAANKKSLPFTSIDSL